MRQVVLQIGVTLDGFVHGAQGYEDWGLPPEEGDSTMVHTCRPLRGDR